VRDGTLLSQRLDLSRQELTGDPITIAENVYYDGTTVNVGAFSVAESDAIAYRTGGIIRRRFTWFDRSGSTGETIGPADANSLTTIELSPDGRRVATYRIVQENADIWIVDAARTVRFTFDDNVDEYPIWSSDGRQILFDSNRSGTRDLYTKTSDGSSSERLLTETPKGNKVVHDISPDGRWLLFGNGPGTGTDIWVLSLGDDRKPFRLSVRILMNGPANSHQTGRWVAYTSNESGRDEVYVRRFPGPGGSWQISTSGGAQPRWECGGKELYYIAPDATLMAVPIADQGDAIEPGTPVPLFKTRIWSVTSLNRMQYDVARDGRFLINVAVDQESLSPITLLLNWNPDRQN